MVIEENHQTVHCGAQEPTVNSKSFVEKCLGLFTYIIKFLFVKPKDVVYVNPEISIEFKPNTVGVFSYLSDSRGKARINLILPEDFTRLSHFLQTPHNTELLATFTGNHTGMSNLGSTRNVHQTTTHNSGSTQTGNSMPNLGSTRNVYQTTTNKPGSTQTGTSMSNLGSTRSVHQTTTNNYGSIQIETSIHGSKESIYQTDEYEASSTQSENGIDSFTSRMNPQQAEEYDSNVMKIVTGIHGSRESVYQTDKYEASSTQSENGIHGSRESIYQTDKYEASSTQSENVVDSLLGRKNKRKSEDGLLGRKNKTKRMHGLGSTESVEQTYEYERSSGQSEKGANSFLGRKNERNEYKKRRHYQRTAMASLKWNKTKRLVLNKKKVLLHTAKYQIEGCSYSKDTCQLFINESGLFSAAAFRHLFKISNNIVGRWSLLSLSKSENHLYIERIDDPPPTILYKITVEARRKNPTNSTKGDLNIDDDVETDNKVTQNLESYIPEEQITRDTDIETDNNVPHNLNYNIPEKGITHDPLQTVPSKKEHNGPFWTTGIKMKRAKVKTRSRPPEFKIYLQSQDDEVQDLVNGYFGDDIIRQCVHDFFESDVDRIRTQKGVFERPHIQWPSMHPRLPYKLRYLDEHVEDSEIGNQDHVQQQKFSPTAAGEYNEESSSDSISVKSDSSDDETK